MKQMILDTRFWYCVLAGIAVLVTGGFLLVYRSTSSPAISCEEDHLQLTMKIDTANDLHDLAAIQKQIKAFTDHYTNSIPKARLTHLVNDLCWNVRDKENELKRRG